MTRKKIAIWSIVAASILAIAATAIILRLHHWKPRTLTIQGAVIRMDEDTRKELPISDADVTATDGVTTISTQSDAAGYFKILFPEAVWKGQKLDIAFHHDDYKPFELKLPVGLSVDSKRLYVATLTPSVLHDGVAPKGPVTVVSNIRVRYTVNSETDENIGSAVRTFQVVNKGDVPCDGHGPCSPDGNWKAASGSVSLDAGPENEFRNARASCIAGPCPFTRIDSTGFVNGGRVITASAVDWSDTATFLLEAEVFRTGMASRVRQLYPVLFGQALHFTLPPTEEGVTIEADVNGTPMVFPMGPELYLSWATCSVRGNQDGENTQVYRCELKPGYKF